MIKVNDCILLKLISIYLSHVKHESCVLGPLIFIIYIDPIMRIISSCGLKFHMYADNIQIYTKYTTDKELLTA